MSQLDRLAYLDAMGVDVWLKRPQPASAIQQGLSTRVADAALADGSVDGDTGPQQRQVAPADSLTAPVSPPERPSLAGHARQHPSDQDSVVAAQEAAQQPPQRMQLAETAASDKQLSSEADLRVELISGVDERHSVTLDSLQREAADCQRCELSATRLQSVFGRGNSDADWMFVGEAPGAEEDRQGLPFVGPAGKLLDAMLAAIGLATDDVYIANLVKCRPPRNRDPRPQELIQCQSFIRGQLEIVQPRVIVALGRFAAQYLTQSTQSIGRLRGKTYKHAVTGIPIVATYHPAYLLRSPVEKAKVWRDLLHARNIISSTD